MDKEPEVVTPLTESPPTPYTAPSPPVVAASPIVAGVTEILEQLIQATKEKFEDRKAVKKLSIPELVTQIAELVKAIKTTQINLPGHAQKNLDTIRQYTNAFDAADRSQRKEVRHQIRNKLRKRPE